MKMSNVNMAQAKSKAAALNQINVILSYLQNNSQKEVNLMKDKIKAEDKIKDIQKHLDEIESRLSVLSENTDNWKQIIKALKDEFKITEAEILAVRGSLIKEKISQLEKLAEIEKDGSGYFF